MSNLYQELRPTLFKDVIGHEVTLRELVSRSKDDSFSQVILLSGNTGTGKTTLQRIIAKAITCLNKNKKTGEPCNKCKYCKDIDEERFSLSVHEFDAAGEGIDGLRRIESEASMKSILGSKKVFIIDEVQALHSKKEAKQKLLKLLEKKRSNTYFILGTMDESKVPSAVVNRCTKYKLRPVSSEQIAKYLYTVVCAKGFDVTEDMVQAMFTIAEHSQGSLRTALSFLERCIRGNIWNEEQLIEELDLISSDALLKVAGGLLQGDVAIANKKITEDIFYKIRCLLLLVYKLQCGVKLNAWEQKQIGSLNTFDAKKVYTTIFSMNEVMKYSYLNQFLIDFTILNILMRNKH